MQRISLLAHNILADYPSFTFVQDAVFRWSPHNATIYHAPLTTDASIWSLLHEIAHAELRHSTYGLDIQLVQQETQAWEYAAALLAPKYGVTITEDYLQDHLDTYRVWLHQRSCCPACGQNGVQTKNTYSCLNCRCLWRTNEARLCALRRTKLPSQNQFY